MEARETVLVDIIKKVLSVVDAVENGAAGGASTLPEGVFSSMEKAI